MSIANPWEFFASWIIRSALAAGDTITSGTYYDLLSNPNICQISMVAVSSPEVPVTLTCINNPRGYYDRLLTWSGPGNYSTIVIPNPVVGEDYTITFGNDPNSQYTVSWTETKNPGDWPGDTNLVVNGHELDVVGAVSAGGAGIPGTDCNGNPYMVNVCDGGFTASPNANFTYTCAVGGIPGC